MAKSKKDAKSKSKKKDAKSESEKQDAKRTETEKAQRKADAAAAAKAAKAGKKADELAAAAKQARKAADTAAQRAAKAEAKASEAAKAAGRPVSEKADELGLARLALRAAEARLTSTEIRLEQVQQQLDDERLLQDEAVAVVLEDALVDAAVQATVEEAVADVVVEAPGGEDVDDALVLEAVAVELEAVVAGVDLPPEEPSHEGEAEEAAAVFTEALSDDEPAPAAAEAAPPLPAAADPAAPSATWTLVQLREEAKRRGLVGVSNLPKAALVERLRSS